MLLAGSIIKTAMKKRGFRHNRMEDQLTLHGEYVRCLQFVYSKEYSTRDGLVVDLVYFAADVVLEHLVIGLFRENPNIEQGTFINASRSIPLQKFNADEIGRALDKLIPPMAETKNK